MMKTILILSSLLAGMVSFAAQSSQTHLVTKKYRIPATCTVITMISNMKVQMTGANCMSLLSKTQFQLFSPDPLAGGSGTLFGPANDPLIPYLLP